MNAAVPSSTGPSPAAPTTRCSSASTNTSAKRPSSTSRSSRPSSNGSAATPGTSALRHGATTTADTALLESTFPPTGSIDLMTQELVMLDAVLLAEAKDHANWSCLAVLAENMSEGETRDALREAVGTVFPQAEERFGWGVGARGNPPHPDRAAGHDRRRDLPRRRDRQRRRPTAAPRARSRARRRRRLGPPPGRRRATAWGAQQRPGRTDVWFELPLSPPGSR
jgi:hypothetical protein